MLLPFSYIIWTLTVQISLCFSLVTYFPIKFKNQVCGCVFVFSSENTLGALVEWEKRNILHFFQLNAEGKTFRKVTFQVFFLGFNHTKGMCFFTFLMLSIFRKV
jgi:hypothetical protein